MTSPSPAGSVTPSSLASLRLLQSGAEALSAGRIAEACEAIQRAVDDGAADGTAWFLLGVARLAAGEAAPARAALERASALQPDDLGTLTALARAAWILGDVGAAIDALDRASRLPDADARTLSLLGLLCLESGRLAEALGALLEAVRRDPEHVDGHRGLALFAERTADFARAELAWRSALALRPGDALFLAGLAGALHAQDRPEEALPCHEALVRLLPGDPRQHAQLAATLAAVGRGAEARSAWETALLLMPEAGEERAWVFFAYGITLLSLGDHDGAVLAWHAALRDEVGLHAARAALAELALDRGDGPAALVQLADLLDAGAISAEHLLALALLAEELDRPELFARAAATLNEAPGDDAELRFRRAQLHLHSRHPDWHDPQAALELLHALLADGLHDRPAVWDLLARALADQGRYESALHAVDRALAGSEPGGPAWQRYRDSRSAYLSALTGR